MKHGAWLRRRGCVIQGVIMCRSMLRSVHIRAADLFASGWSPHFSPLSVTPPMNDQSVCCEARNGREPTCSQLSTPMNATPPGRQNPVLGCWPRAPTCVRPPDEQEPGAESCTIEWR